MNSKFYKCCAVPLCKNTSISTPNKLFVYVPNKKLVREEWLKLARRDPANVVTNSSIYFCEDHFDLPSDMENYMEYHIIGSVSQVRMKPGCMPKKFACQPDRQTRTADTIEQPYISKKRKMMSLETCEKHLKKRTEHLKEEIAISSVPDNCGKPHRETSKMISKSIQVYITKPFRSKANQTEPVLINQMTSQLKPFHSISTSPFKTNDSIKINASRPSESVLRRIVKLKEPLNSDSYTASIKRTESPPSTKSLKIKIEPSDCREPIDDDKKRELLKTHLPCYRSPKMTIRWGIVSAAKICNDFVNAINSFPDKGDQVVAAIAARDCARAEAFAKIHGIKMVFDSYQAMAESTGIVDVVYIGALNPDHFALAKLFLEHGKHVLCEKPLCLNHKQAKVLCDLAKDKKLFLMEAVWSRFAPAYAGLEEEISSGKLGDVRVVEVNFGVPIVSVDRLSKKALGGSVVLDLGVYVLQFAQFVFKDEPTKVTAVGSLNDDGVDILETIVLEYSGGRRAVLTADATVKMWNKATVTGTKGRATLEDPFHFPDTLIRADGSVETYPLHASALPYNFGNSAGLVYEAVEVARCIRQGLLESPRMPHADSLVLAKLEDTVRHQLGVHFDADDEDYC